MDAVGCRGVTDVHDAVWWLCWCLMLVLTAIGISEARLARLT